MYSIPCKRYHNSTNSPMYSVHITHTPFLHDTLPELAGCSGRSHEEGSDEPERGELDCCHHGIGERVLVLLQKTLNFVIHLICIFVVYSMIVNAICTNNLILTPPL